MSLKHKALNALDDQRSAKANATEVAIQEEYPHLVKAITDKLRAITGDPLNGVRFFNAHKKTNGTVAFEVVLVAGQEAYRLTARTYGDDDDLVALIALWLMPADDRFCHPEAQSFRGRAFHDLASLGDAILGLEKACRPVTLNGEDFWRK